MSWCIKCKKEDFVEISQEDYVEISQEDYVGISQEDYVEISQEDYVEISQQVIFLPVQNRTENIIFKSRSVIYNALKCLFCFI